jgi:ribosomal protein S18 acetylase RimI-like enzyme
VRRAGATDAAAVGRMLDGFNREFGDPTPGPEFLAERIAELIEAGEATVMVTGEGPDGLSVLRVRPAIWSGANEAYLAELYVVPERRGRGLGRALLEATLEVARDAGCDHIELGTGETDTAARALYERLGFINTEGPEGPPMLWYEREL